MRGCGRGGVPWRRECIVGSSSSSFLLPGGGGGWSVELFWGGGGELMRMMSQSVSGVGDVDCVRVCDA